MPFSQDETQIEPHRSIGEALALEYCCHLFELEVIPQTKDELVERVAERVPDRRLQEGACNNPVLRENHVLLGKDVPRLVWFMAQVEGLTAFLSRHGNLPKRRFAAQAFVVFFREMKALSLVEGECDSLLMDPAIRRTAAWHCYTWKLRRDAEDTRRRLQLREEDVALQTIEAEDMHWLTNVKTEDLVRLREAGEMEEMRSLFRASRKRLKATSLDEFEEVSNEVRRNLLAAIRAHSEDLRKETGAWKRRMAWSVTGAIGTVGLAVASIALPAILPLAIASGVASTIGLGSSARQALNEFFSGEKRLDFLRRRPIGVLARARGGDGKAE